MRRRIIGSVALVALLFGFTQLPLLAGEFDNTTGTYLPLVNKPELPTATPEPTAAPEPTAVPQPTAKPPSTVAVLPKTFAYVDSIDYLHIVGEVQNNTNRPQKFVKIIANIYGSGGVLLGNDYAYSGKEILNPGESTCFEESLKVPAGWQSYQFEAVSSRVADAPTFNLAISGDSGSVDSSEYYKVIGFVQNNGAAKVTFVQVIGTLYDVDDTPVDCDSTYVNSTDLEAGQSSSFTLSGIRSSVATVARYRLQPDAN